MSQKFPALLLQDGASISACRSRVAANGVALLFAYLCHFICQAYLTFIRKDDEQNSTKQVTRKLTEISKVMFWFGLVTMFSIYPPYYYGTQSAIFAWFTLIALVLMHVFAFGNQKVKERTLWSIFYFIYHLLIMIWLFAALVAAYAWSSKATNSV